MRLQRYSALLLDFGGVCLLNPVELHRQVEATLGLAPYTFTWMGPIDPSTDALWRDMQGGGMTEREYWHCRAGDVGRACGRAMSVRKYMHFCYNRPEEEIIRREAVRAVAAVRAIGIKVGILTNDLEAFHGPGWKEQLGFFRMLDALTDCSRTGVLKPDPRAYAQALADFGVKPDEVLFVDDQPLNVEGARQCGIETIYFDVARAKASWNEVEARVLGAGLRSPDGCAPQ